MKKRGKKYLEALSKIEKGKAYTKEEAIKLVKETSVSKFDASVELAVRLNLDTKKADQQLRGAIVLPHGTGKTKKVLVIAKGDNAKKAVDAGADFVGDMDMVEKIEKENWFEFDTLIATPDAMPLLGRLGRILGPKTLPNFPSKGIMSGVAIITSNSNQFSFSIFSNTSVSPTKSAPASFALVAFSPLATTKTFFVLPVP